MGSLVRGLLRRLIRRGERGEVNPESAGNQPAGVRMNRWAVLGESVRGASHIRSGLPNQDAIECFPAAEPAPEQPSVTEAPLIVAVADGHGSSKSFRSALGASIAVSEAVQLTRDFVEHVRELTPAAIRTAEASLPTAIVRGWKTKVADHYTANAFTEEELANVDVNAPNARIELLGDQGFFVAYGATLLVAAVTENYLLFLQLGDGDILTVYDDGQRVEVPIAPDETLLGNETTSLCLPNAHCSVATSNESTVMPHI